MTFLKNLGLELIKYASIVLSILSGAAPSIEKADPNATGVITATEDDITEFEEHHHRHRIGRCQRAVQGAGGRRAGRTSQAGAGHTGRRGRDRTACRGAGREVYQRGRI